MPTYAFQHPHRGEIAARRQFLGDGRAEEPAAMIRDRLTPDMVAFMESLPFFFIATANHAGECDCSYRGRQSSASASPEPLLRVLSPTVLEFPDYPGNNLFNSLGNLLVNPHLGMLFIDFARPRRLRINGTAQIVEQRAVDDSWWPGAPRLIQVAVVQAFPNCRARIPTLVPA